MTSFSQGRVVEFERAVDAGVQARLKALEADWVELHLSRLVWSQAHSVYVLAPLAPLRVVRGFKAVEMRPAPALGETLSGAALLLDFTCGDGYTYLSDDSVWSAALDFANVVWPNQPRDARHLSETLAVALAGRCGCRVIFSDLPNIDYPKLGQITDELDTAAAAAQAARRVPPPPPTPPARIDPDVELDAAEARRALAASLTDPDHRPSRR